MDSAWRWVPGWAKFAQSLEARRLGDKYGKQGEDAWILLHGLPSESGRRTRRQARLSCKPKRMIRLRPFPDAGGSAEPPLPFESFCHPTSRDISPCFKVATIDLNRPLRYRAVQSTASTFLMSDSNSFQLNEADLEETFARSSGPGGQHVNKVSTAVTLRHRPSGVSVTVQDSRSQATNRRIARQRLVTAIERERAKDRAAKRALREKERRRKSPRPAKLKKTDPRVETKTG